MRVIDVREFNVICSGGGYGARLHSRFVPPVHREAALRSTQQNFTLSDSAQHVLHGCLVTIAATAVALLADLTRSTVLERKHEDPFGSVLRVPYTQYGFLSVFACL